MEDGTLRNLHVGLSCLHALFKRGKDFKHNYILPDPEFYSSSEAVLINRTSLML